MNLALRLMNGSRVVIDNVSTWEVSDLGLHVTDQEHKKYWYNRQFIATIEEENK